MQYSNITLLITGVNKGTSKAKVYSEHDFELLQSRTWFLKLLLFYKIVKNKSTFYFHKLIPKASPACSTRNLKICISLKLMAASLKTFFSIQYHRSTAPPSKH